MEDMEAGLDVFIMEEYIDSILLKGMVPIMRELEDPRHINLSEEGSRRAPGMKEDPECTPGMVMVPGTPRTDQDDFYFDLNPRMPVERKNWPGRGYDRYFGFSRRKSRILNIGS